MSKPTPANSGTSINTLMGDLNVTAPFTPGEAPEDWPELTASSENARQADPRPCQGTGMQNFPCHDCSPKGHPDNTTGARRNREKW